MIKGDGLLKNQRPNCDTTEYFENAFTYDMRPTWALDISHVFACSRYSIEPLKCLPRPFGQLYNTKIICLKMKMYKKSYRIFIHINT